MPRSIKQMPRSIKQMPRSIKHRVGSSGNGNKNEVHTHSRTECAGANPALELHLPQPHSCPHHALSIESIMPL
jgi:hypothetical protein